jgi:hypothetical protein
MKWRTTGAGHAVMSSFALNSARRLGSSVAALGDIEPEGRVCIFGIELIRLRKSVCASATEPLARDATPRLKKAPPSFGLSLMASLWSAIVSAFSTRSLDLVANEAFGADWAR